MKRIMYRIWNAIKVGMWAYRNPKVAMNHQNLKMINGLFGLIFKVAMEDKPYMTHIAYVHPDEGEKSIVSIWAGAGIGAEPSKRIAELVEENRVLKSRLESEAEMNRNVELFLKAHLNTFSKK